MPDTTQWDLLGEARSRYPGLADQPDQAIIDHFSNPDNFRSGFPEYSGLDDATIKHNVSQYKPKGEGFLPSMYESLGLPGDVSTWPGQAYAGAKQMLTHPVDTAGLLLGGMSEATKAQYGKAAELWKQPGVVPKLKAAQQAIPIVGPSLTKSGEQLEAGNISGAVGTATGVGAQLLGPELAKVATPRIASTLAGADISGRIFHPTEAYNAFGDSVYNSLENAAHIAKTKPALQEVTTPGAKYDTPYKQLFEDPKSPIKQILDQWDPLNNRVIDPKNVTGIINSNQHQLTGQIETMQKNGIPLPDKLVKVSSGLHRAFAQISPNVMSVGPAAGVTYRIMEHEPGQAAAVAGIYAGTVGAKSALTKAFKTNLPAALNIIRNPMASKGAFAPPPFEPGFTGPQPVAITGSGQPTGSLPGATVAEPSTPPEPPTGAQLYEQAQKGLAVTRGVAPTPPKPITLIPPRPAGETLRSSATEATQPALPKVVAKSPYQSFLDRITGTSDMRVKDSILREAMQYAKENPDQLPPDKIPSLTQRARTHMGERLKRPGPMR